MPRRKTKKRPVEPINVRKPTSLDIVPIVTGAIGSTFASKPKRITSFLNNATCRQLGVVTKGLNGLPDFPSLEIDFDALHLEDEELSYEITCQNVQERPPLDSINNVQQPFFPCLMDVNDQNEDFVLESHHRKAYVLSRQYQDWKKQCLEHKHFLTSCYSTYPIQEFQKHCFQKSEVMDKVLVSELDYNPKKAGYWPSTNSVKRMRPKFLKLFAFFDEYPFGPVNMYSSSCIQSNSDHEIMFSNHTKNLTVGSFDENQTFKEKVALADDFLATNSRIFGFKTNEEFTALRYRDGAALINHEEKQLVSRMFSDIGICDMTINPHLDSMLGIDVQGNIIRHNYLVSYKLRFNHSFVDICISLQEKTEIRSPSTSKLKDDVEKYEWSTMQNHDMSVFLSRILTRKNVFLYDVRKGKIVENLFEFGPTEACGNFTRSHRSPYQVSFTSL